MSSAGAPPAVDADFRSDLRATARGFLERSASTAVVRGLIEAGGRPASLEAETAELGWLGVEIPEKYGGLGAGFGDLTVILHELGRLLSPTTIATTTVLGVGAVLLADDPLRARWLPAIATGDAVVTAALTGPAGTPGRPDIVATREADGWSLDGTAGFVPDLAEADAVAIAAREADTDAVVLFMVPTGTEGLRVVSVPMVDRTRRLARLEAASLVVTPEQRIGHSDHAVPLVAPLLERAAVAVSADAVGGAERVLELTVEHLRTRRQFGRPLGLFQALKHRCADMLFALEGSRSAVDHAAELVGGPAGAVAASIAKSYAGDAYVRIAQEGVQLHGGIGYTWEYDLHLYLKRARLSQVLFGDSAWHREVLARAASGSL